MDGMGSAGRPQAPPLAQPTIERLNKSNGPSRLPGRLHGIHPVPPATRKRVMNATSKSKPKVASAFAPYEMPKFELPKFEFPTDGVPVAFREYAEQAAAQAKDAYDKIKASTEQANGMLEATYAAAAEGSASYGKKLVEVARTNTMAAFDFAQDLMATKSLPELVEVSNKHGRKQYETVSAQTKELAALAQEFATRTAEPAKAGFEKVAEQAA
jgi:phasin